MGEIQLLYILIAITILFVAYILFRPSLMGTTGGKLLVFGFLFVLPLLTAISGGYHHLEHAKETTFCLSCHIMHPYGKSLLVDSDVSLPALHYQKRLVPRDQACYTCHTNYTMFGGVKSKMHGLRHVWIYYFGKPANPIHLYEPYNNRECLHCHDGARPFEENPVHSDPDLMAELKSNKTSCLTCHDTAHIKDTNVKYWKDPDTLLPKGAR